MGQHPQRPTAARRGGRRPERPAAAGRSTPPPLDQGVAEPVGTLRTLNRPRRARVRVGRDYAPLTIDGAEVELIRETWLIEDAWWTDRPLRRRYWEAITRGGKSVVIFHDLCSGHWFTQAG